MNHYKEAISTLSKYFKSKTVRSVFKKIVITFFINNSI